MIQYSSINDAWGYKDTYKKNSLNNIENFANKNTINVELITNNTNHPVPHNDTHNDTHPIHHNDNNDTHNNTHNNTHNDTHNIHPISHHEHFMNPIINNNSCSFAEHFKTCDHCKDSFIEYFNNNNYNNNNNNNNKIIKTINLLGLEINITKDVLKVIFILIIILIFVLLLSTVNISFKNKQFTQMKYYTMPQNMPYYHH